MNRSLSFDDIKEDLPKASKPTRVYLEAEFPRQKIIRIFGSKGLGFTAYDNAVNLPVADAEFSETGLKKIKRDLKLLYDNLNTRRIVWKVCEESTGEATNQ
jgi:hypothetical protein